MNYKTGYCFTSRDLYDGWDCSQVGVKRKIYREKYKWRLVEDMFGAIFLYFMSMVLMDIIENNVTFALPLKGNRHAMIHVKVFDGDQFQRMYAGGKFVGIDFLSSLFRGYQLFFHYNYREGERDKPIYINNKMKERFYAHINAGKEYY